MVRAKSRLDVSLLLDRLKQEKLYKLEMERQKDIESKKEQEAELSERLEGSLDETDTKEEKSIICEICSERFESGLELLRHYARSHLANKMKDKFSHLTNKLNCKLCKEAFEEETDLFVHIGADHKKINLIMKENGLKPVEIKETAKSQNAAAVMIDELKNSETETDTLEALEMKLQEVKKQMSDSCEENLLVHSMAEINDLAECQSDSEEEIKVAKKEDKKTSRGKRKKKRGRPRKEEPESLPLRRSSRHKSGSDIAASKVVDVTKETNQRERKEARPSCHKCGQWEMMNTNRVYPCR